MAIERNGLTITSRRGNEVASVQDDRLILRGQTEWLVTGLAALLDAIEKAATAGIAERLGNELLLLNFGNSIGRLTLPEIGTIEIVTGKLNDKDFDWMLKDLMDVASNLPFAANAPTALPYDRTDVADDVLYHAFVYLRHVMADGATDQLLTALQLILRDPHRRFERETVVVPIEHATRIDSNSLMAMITGSTPLSQARGRIAETPAARALHGHLPRDVRETRVFSSVDTPENRFVKAFLGQASGIVDGMQRRMNQRANDVFRSRILAECDQLKRQLRPIVQHSLWQEVGPMVHLPTGSTVLQRRRGYREVFRHFARLRLAARVPLSKETVRDLLEAKDIALLYEIWCFYAVVRCLTTLHGQPVQAGGPSVLVDGLAMVLKHDAEVVWSNGVRALYNATFTRTKGAERRSYSLPLRPDITVVVPDGPNAGLHLFDAKFKVDWLDDDREQDAERADAEERRGPYNQADLYKMHTYRDAIPSALSVSVLYPGHRERDFPIAPDSVAGVGVIAAIPAPAANQSLLDRLKRITSTH